MPHLQKAERLLSSSAPPTSRDHILVHARQRLRLTVTTTPPPPQLQTRKHARLTVRVSFQRTDSALLWVLDVPCSQQPFPIHLIGSLHRRVAFLNRPAGIYRSSLKPTPPSATIHILMLGCRKTAAGDHVIAASYRVGTCECRRPILLQAQYPADYVRYNNGPGDYESPALLPHHYHSIPSVLTVQARRDMTFQGFEAGFWSPTHTQDTSLQRSVTDNWFSPRLCPVRHGNGSL